MKGMRDVVIKLDEEMYEYVRTAAKSYEVPVAQFVAQLFLDRFKELTQEIADAQTRQQKAQAN